MTNAEPHAAKLSAPLAVVLALVAFLPALGNRFALDDVLASAAVYGRVNDEIATAHGPLHYFGRHYWAGIDDESRLYRPVTILGFAWTYQCLSRPALPPDWPAGAEQLAEDERDRLLGREAFPHHLLNLLLNGWAALLVFRLLRGVHLPHLAAGLAACLFAVHALHAEVVATVVGRAELLAFCFGAAATLVFLAGRGARGVRLAASGALFFLAFASKESAVAWALFLPCYLLARAWRADPGIAWHAVLRRHAAALAAVLLPALLVFLVLRQAALAGLAEGVPYPANPLYHEPTGTRLLTAVERLGFGLWQCVAPFDPAALYGIRTVPLVTSAADWRFAAAAAGLLAWLVPALRRPARRPLLFLSAACFFGFALPTSNLLFAIGTVYGERLYFTPSLGACLLPALLLQHVGPAGRRVLLAACGAWLCANLVADVLRAKEWRDSDAILGSDAARHPDCAPLQLLAAREETGRAPGSARALELVLRALAADPGYVDAVAEEGRLHLAAGRTGAALASFRRALALPRLAASGQEAAIRKELGQTLLGCGDADAGLQELLRALELRPADLALRAQVATAGIDRLPPALLDRIVRDGEQRVPGSATFALLRAELLFRHAPREQAAPEIVAILTGVLGIAPPEALAEARFREAQLQLATCLGALGRSDEARHGFTVVLEHPAADARQKAAARDGLARLER